MEKELEGKITFLDVQIERKGTATLTSVFRKKTHTDRYLDFNSHHPAKVLRGVMQCLWVRAKKVCEERKQWQEIQRLRQVFRANGYPKPVVKNNLRCRSTPPRLLHLPYVRGVSEQNEKMWRPLGVKTVMKTADTLRSRLVKLKQAIPNSKKKSVIYEIPWKDRLCVYIGETGRTLEKPLSEHKAAVKKNDPKNGIAVHAWANQHQVNWEAASVKQEKRSYWRRKVLEALHINSPTASDLESQLWTIHQHHIAPPAGQTTIPQVTPPDP